MHASSFNAMQFLIGKLVDPSTPRPIRVLDVGSMIADERQTSYRSIFDALPGVEYTGLDMAPGRNVDVVAVDPFKFPLEAESFDFVVSGQAFEHIEFPWLTIQEIARVLKKGGAAIIIAPSSGPEHRYPQDCWRYYPDGMRALAKWAGLECVQAATNWRETQMFMWGDTIGVLYKPLEAGDPTHRPEIELHELQQHQRGTKRDELYIGMWGLLSNSYRRLGRVAARALGG